MKFNKVYLYLIVFILVSACTRSYTWVKLGSSNSEFYKSKSYCQALSSGATPMDYSNQGSSTTYHSGSVYGSSGTYGTYSGTSTTYNNNTGQALANLGKSIKRQNLFNDCMRGQGWVPEEEYQKNSASSWDNSSRPFKDVESFEEWEEADAEYVSAEVKFGQINVLAKPSLSGDKVGSLVIGQKIEVIKKVTTQWGVWLYIRHNGLEGYVIEDWVSVKM